MFPMFPGPYLLPVTGHCLPRRWGVNGHYHGHLVVLLPSKAEDRARVVGPVDTTTLLFAQLHPDLTALSIISAHMRSIQGF
jgi:hypothetical protein